MGVLAHARSAKLEMLSGYQQLARSLATGFCLLVVEKTGRKRPG
jgi:hypothetical protein